MGAYAALLSMLQYILHFFQSQNFILMQIEIMVLKPLRTSWRKKENLTIFSLKLRVLQTQVKYFAIASDKKYNYTFFIINLILI